MNRPVKHLAFTSLAASLTLGTALLTGACSSADGKTNERAAPPVAAVSATAGRGHRAADRPLHPRHRDADGRGTGRRRRRNRRPRRRDADRARDRGPPGHRADSSVGDGNRSAGQRSRSQRRADRSAARPDRGVAASTSMPCPKCRTRKATYELAQSEFARIQSLLEQRVVSQSEFDQRRTQVEAARQQFEASQERRGAAVPGAAGGARARLAGAEGAGRHRRPRAVQRAGRRAAGLGRRLRHPGHQGGGGRPGQSVAGAVDGARAVHLGDRRRASRSPSRWTPIAGRQFEGKVRYVSPTLASRSARVDGRSDRPQRRQRAEAGAVRHGAHPAAEADAGAWSCRPPRCARPAARAACSSSTATMWKSASSPSDRRSTRWSKSPTASRPASASRRPTSRSSPTARKCSNENRRVRGSISCNGLPRSASNVRSSRPCSSCR